MSVSRSAVRFPKELQPSVDALVAAARKGVVRPVGKAFGLVTSWCNKHWDESGVETGDNGEGFLVVDLKQTLSSWSDDEIEMAEGVDVAEITDEIRSSFIRERLEEIFEYGSEKAESYPMGCTMRIRASTGQTACLAYFLSGGGGMGGPDVHWEGVYRDMRAFRATLRRNGELTSQSDADRMSDAALLRLRRAVVGGHSK